MNSYMSLYRDLCNQNRNIMTVINKDIGPLYIIEYLGPDFFGEPMVII